jgi:hypothetical protein
LGKISKNKVTSNLQTTNIKKPKKRKKNSKKIFFFSNIANIFTTQKILKLENKHPEHFWSALNSLSENNKKFDFLNT